MDTKTNHTKDEILKFINDIDQYITMFTDEEIKKISLSGSVVLLNVSVLIFGISIIVLFSSGLIFSYNMGLKNTCISIVSVFTLYKIKKLINY